MTYCKDKENLAECILRKLIVLIAVLAFLVPFLTPQVFAASSVRIDGGDSVSGGDTFTVTVTYGDNIGRVDGSLTYDTDMLTYISGGSSSGNSGYIQLSEGSTDGIVVFNIKFQALKDGDATIEVNTREMYDLNEMYMEETPSAVKTISIAGSAASEEVITQTESPEEPVEETELSGVDEKPEEGDSDSRMLIMIAAIAIPVILIVIIAVILAKKRNKKGQPNADDEDDIDIYDDQDGPGGYEGYSAGSFEYEPREEYGPEADNDNGRTGEEPVRAGRVERMNAKKRKKAVKKKASDETESWSDWNGFDDDDMR